MATAEAIFVAPVEYVAVWIIEVLSKFVRSVHNGSLRRNERFEPIAEGKLKANSQCHQQCEIKRGNCGVLAEGRLVHCMRLPKGPCSRSALGQRFDARGRNANVSALINRNRAKSARMST